MLVRGATRGDGIRGEDVTVNLRTIGSVPLRMAPDGEPAGAARGAGRGLLAALGLPRAQRARSPDRQEARTEPAQRRRRLAAAEELGRSPPTARSRSGCTASVPARASSSTSQSEMLAWLREHGFRTNPHAERLETIERGRRRLRAVGEPARRARLRDRRDRDQGRLVRPAGAARGAARAAAVGARVQVGAVDRGHDAATGSTSGSGGPAPSTRGPSSSRCRSAASPSRRRRCTTRRTSTARTSARATS